jgi:signal transduction histidine kinase
MRIRLLLFFVTCFLGFLVSTSVWADDLITSREVLQDRAGTLSIDQVAQSQFAPMGPMLNAGYTDAVHWLRLRIKAPTQGGQIELRIRPTFLDEVLLFESDPHQPEKWIQHVTGDRTEFAQRERATTTLGFKVNAQAPQTTYYLRLKSTASSLLNVQAFTPHEAAAQDLRLSLLMSLYLGFMLWLLFWAANDYLLHRQQVVGLFLIYQTCYCVYAVSTMGYLPLLLISMSAARIDLFTNLIICLTPPLSLFFNRMVLRLFEPPRWALHGLDALVGLGVLNLLVLALGYTLQATRMNSLIILLAAPAFIGLAFAARLNAPPGLRVIRSIYLLQGISLLVSMLAFLGWVNATEWNLFATLAHGFVSSSLMFFLLRERSRELSRQASLAGVELEVTRGQLAIKNLQKQQQERFIAMLTHELKTPMSVIRIALGKLQLTNTAQRRAARALSDMTGIVEHCQQVDQLEQQQLVAQSVPCHIGELITELQASSGAPQRLLLETQTLPSVTTDPQLLRIVLGNLIDNALKYAAPGSPIHLQAAPCARGGRPGVQLVVRNPVGPVGLPDADKVFDKYYRSPGSHRKSGSGLGLYLVKSYMQLLGGQVSYAVVDDQVEFTLWMPS